MPMLYGGRCNWLQSEEANCDGDRFQIDTSTLSFRELLALAEKGRVLNSTEFVTVNTSTFCFPVNASRQQFPGFMNSQMQEKYGVSQFPTNSEEDTLDNCMAANAGGASVSNRCSIDLNSLPREDANEDSRDALMHLPLPKENKEDDQQDTFDMKYMDEEESDTGYEAENSKTSGVGHLQEVEDSSQINGQRPTTSTSVYLQENHKFDKVSAEESPLLTSPKQKPRRKRHRPKVITEDQADRSPKPNAKKTANPLTKTNIKPPQHRAEVEESHLKSSPYSVPLVQHRKYTKRKNIDEYRGEEAKIDTQPTCRIIRSSCRRSLNFNMDNEEGDGSPSSYCVTELEEAKNNAQGKDELSEKYDTRIPREPGKNSNQEACVRYGQQSSGQMEGKTTDNTFCREEKVLKLKDEQSVEPETCILNKTGTIYNKLQAHYKSLQTGLVIFSESSVGSEVPGLLQTCKRKRTEKRRDLKIASQTGYKRDKQSLGDSSASLITQIMIPITSRIQYVVDAPGRSRALDDAHNAEQRLRDIYASDCIPTIKRKRSKCPTQPRDSASLLFCKELSVSRCRAEGSVGGKNKKLQSPPACMEALGPYTHSEMPRKKRTKRNRLLKSTEQRMCSHKGPSTGRKGWSLALTWNNEFPVDTIIQQLQKLDIKTKSRHTSIQKESYSLVPYQGSRAVVPFDSSSVVKKQRLRPKVNLDEETTTVWQLLLENIHNEGIDGNDEEKAKRWEEERRIFNGRANSFIARMHLVQGDRRFSPWKGSVVDSVVGVFLTQNVSDHLSSSAFMSMAARFPVTVNAGKPGSHEIYSEIKLSEVLECDLQGSYGLTKDNSNHSIAEAHHKAKSEVMREISVKSTGHILNGFLQEDTANDLECEGTKNLEAVPRKSIDFSEDEGYTKETLSSQVTEISSQNSTATPTARAMETICSYFGSNEEIAYAATQDKCSSSNFLEKLMQRTVNGLQVDQFKENRQEICIENGEFQKVCTGSSEHSESHLCNQESLATTITLSIQSCVYDDSVLSTQTGANGQPEEKTRYLDSLLDKEVRTVDASELSSESSVPTRSWSRKPVNKKHSGSETSEFADRTMCSRYISLEEASAMERVNSNTEAKSDKRCTNSHRVKAVSRPKEKGKTGKEKENWEALRKKVLAEGKKSARRANADDTVDWDAVRCTDVNEVAQTIKSRGMNNNLAERIKEFLNRLVLEHGSIDLEWLRDIPPDKAKEYLLSFRGLGLKSVECVRLLTLHHLAFPVDTNVGRIAVRLGWVPLQPLPESLQLHLLELYPVLESIQKYLWPRLCKLDQKTLYELHYQMITFGKVFCTKNKPNCNACPMRAECKHFASAFASARLALPGPEIKKEVPLTESKNNGHVGNMHFHQLPFTQYDQSNYQLRANFSEPIIEEPPSPEPIVEMPATPEPTHHNGCFQYYSDNFLNDGMDEIPKIQLNMEEFTQNLQKVFQQNTGLQKDDMSRALIALTSDAASIPVPKLKNVGRLRTEHLVYELPDSHPLLQKMEKREPDDPSPYLLAIWAPGETANSIQHPQEKCISQDREKLCTDETCSSCSSIRESNKQTVRGTILIPCRTAMRGSFPLNGTYFQVNEVFSDHESSLSPIDIPRDWLWNLPRRTVYFGTSVPTIFRGLTTEEIQYCFWRGFICVRGFDRKERAPRPLIARLHFPASKLTKTGKKARDD